MVYGTYAEHYADDGGDEEMYEEEQIVIEKGN
jgi:hypothetical protein